MTHPSSSPVQTKQRDWPRFGLGWFAALLVVGGFGAWGTMAFPPAPHHLIHGMVRDQFGKPLMTASLVEIDLLGTDGTNVLTTQVVPFLTSSENFRLAVPMDSGLFGAPYKATALFPAVPFTISVTIASIQYQPMEIKGNLYKLGQPGEDTRIDLTLGQDIDKDGLPDAWERSMFAKLGLTWRPGSLNPNALLGDSGLTFRQAYIVGTYNYAPKGGFKLEIADRFESPVPLSFTAVEGRTYSLVGGTNYDHLSPLSFTVVTQGNEGLPMTSYHATSTKKIDVNVSASADQVQLSNFFFKLLVD